MIDRPIVNEKGEPVGHFTRYETWGDFESEIQTAIERFEKGNIKCLKY